MNATASLIESLETRRLMSATCVDLLAAEPSEPQALLPAVQKVREAAARMPATTEGTSDTITTGDAPSPTA